MRAEIARFRSGKQLSRSSGVVPRNIFSRK